MAFDPIPKAVRKVWDTWNLRGFIILSLSLQTTLIFCAPFRKRTSNMFMIFIVWSAYLLADWAAAFAVGLISNSQGDDSQPVDNGDLLAFWAPFLLVHLGGPDTITAFALEDNALWLRHLIGLVFQVFAAFYVFLQTLPDNKLLAPTILMLLAGIIKYAERTRGLYLASLDRFKESMLKEPDAGPNYAKLMDEYASKKEAKIPTRIDYIPEPKKDNVRTTAFDGVDKELQREENFVKYAHQFFETFKGLIVDLIFSFRERNESRTFFQGRTAHEAYKVILIELNFMYEALYTKVVVVHSLIGYIFRFLAFGLTISALIIFIQLTKTGFHRFDVRITYTLLIGAIALDSIAMFMVFFSDWNVANIKYLKKRYRSFGGVVDRCLTPILRPFLARKDPKTSKLVHGKFEYDVMDTPVLCRRWAESMSAYNLIGFCIKVWPETICKQPGWFRSAVSIIVTVITFPLLVIWKLLNYIKIFFETLDRCCRFQYGFVWFFGGVFMFVFDNLGLTEIYEEMTYVSKNAFIKQLWDFIFRELVDKSHLADDPETARMICEARGDWVLQDSSLGLQDHTKVTLADYVSNLEYDQSILLWHIATDLCYYTEDEESLGEQNDYRVFSKLLSDYMLYLLVMQPKMMSAVAGIGQIRFRDTCAEAKKFFDRRGLKSGKARESKQKAGDLKQKAGESKQAGEWKQKAGESKQKARESKLKRACETVLEVNTDVKPITVKGDRSKSVLFDASILAKELKKLKKQGKDKWLVMCKVWVELLSYAASHCRADTHAQVLSKGGELVTLVWLLMAHLGIGEQFQINEGHARAKLMVGK